MKEQVKDYLEKDIYTLLQYTNNIDNARTIISNNVETIEKNIDNISMDFLSMGMSGDYEIAIEEGATWLRLGTVLFGERPKVKPMRAVDAGDAGESGEGGGMFDRVLD